MPVQLIIFWVVVPVGVIIAAVNTAKEIREIQKLPTTKFDITAFTILVICSGVLIGGTLGFLFRPPAPLMGQLPFDAVITRGSDLKGMDSLLKPTAEMSFNYVLGGGVIGGIIFAAWRHLTMRRRTAAASSL